ncbi:MAG: exopolysaccharide biosynthesis polyprenyl glycosylphosphotransferase [Candidatus Omnitrophota bacterium]|jgi:exopolysaccharide biosynthesis polyprenyl glycosylphosphotransferase|nr:MAG: exopolysaccharide biosynthesis polyprenyl glycosylphosphotransferase [Candidatus Omnitrophota bacterium]
MTRSRLLGIDIDSLTREEFLKRIDEFVSSGQPHQICYLNADCLNKCWSDHAYRETIASSDLVYADGMGVVWASRLFGHPLPERLNANDLLPEFCHRAEQKGHRIFLLGGEDGIAEKSAKDLRRRYPNIRIVGYRNGYFAEEDEADVIRQIRDAEPDILIVGMGAPKQELWIRRHLQELNVPVAWGVGGLLDYSAKGLKRAPEWMRTSGLEWIWRLWLEPRRLWKRYLLGNILFTFRVGFLIFADAILAGVAWLAAYYVRANIIPQMDFLPYYFSKDLNPFRHYLYALPVIVFTWIVICASLDLYRRQYLRTALDELTAIVKMVFLFLITSMAVAFLLKELDLGRAVLFFSAMLAFVFLVTSRLIWSRLEKTLFQEGIGRIRALIVGTGEMAQQVVERLRRQPAGKYEILGLLDNHLAPGTLLYNQQVIGPVDELAEWAKNLAADEIFFADPQMKKRDLLNLVISCGENTSVRQYNILTDMFGVIADNAFFDDVDDIPFKVLHQGKLSPLEHTCKRILDIVCASTMLLISFPFFPIICLMIRFSSPGPAIFRHKRIGKDGTPFTMYKFRTMYQEVNEYQEAPIQKGDPRILPIGRWLRRTSLDELPQLWNVLKGEMSMVGPRPEMPFIVESYEPWQRRRLSVLPGITGLWQISGRKDLPLHSNLEYDFYYIQNQSLLFDLIILLKTIPVVLFGKGAY